MSNQCFFGDPRELAAASCGEVIRLIGAEARHAAVKRLVPGENVDVVDGQGLRASCIVVDVGVDSFGLRIEDLVSEPQPQPVVTLIQALAKGDRSELAIEAATELGVDALVPWQADRSIVRWNADKAAKGITKWQSAVLAAAKQSRRSRVPPVGAVVDTARLALLMEDIDLVVVLHETAEVPLTRLLAEHGAQASSIALVVGPEGGVSDQELERFSSSGARTGRLGRNVLRSSTAGPAALSLVMHQLGRWDLA